MASRTHSRITSACGFFSATLCMYSSTSWSVISTDGVWAAGAGAGSGSGSGSGGVRSERCPLRPALLRLGRPCDTDTAIIRAVSAARSASARLALIASVAKASMMPTIICGVSSLVWRGSDGVRNQSLKPSVASDSRGASKGSRDVHFFGAVAVAADQTAQKRVAEQRAKGIVNGQFQVEGSVLEAVHRARARLRRLRLRLWLRLRLRLLLRLGLGLGLGLSLPNLA